jgi:hypothetical protein
LERSDVSLPFRWYRGALARHDRSFSMPAGPAGQSSGTPHRARYPLQPADIGRRAVEAWAALGGGSAHVGGLPGWCWLPTGHVRRVFGSPCKSQGRPPKSWALAGEAVFNPDPSALRISPVARTGTRSLGRSITLDHPERRSRSQPGKFDARMDPPGIRYTASKNPFNPRAAQGFADGRPQLCHRRTGSFETFKD